MPADNGSKLRNREFPKGSGIRIREIINQTGGTVFNGSCMVIVPAKLTGTLRSRKQFKSWEDAEKWAADEYRGFQKQGEGYFNATSEERSELAVCLPKLREHNITLTEAVEFAILRLRPEGGERKVGEVVEEVVGSKRIRYERGDLRERSYKDFRIRAEKFKEAFEETPIKNLTVADLKEWLLGMKTGPRTTQNYLSIVAEILKYAVQKRYIFLSPVDELTDYDRKELCGNTGSFKEPSILTPDEARRLLFAAQEHPEFRLLGAVTLGLFCGIRTEDLKRLRWENVKDRDPQPFVTISGEMAKKRRIRNVDIPKNALPWLTLCLNREGVVAENAHANDYQKRFQKLLKAAGFGTVDNKSGKWKTNWDTNAMRHSFGSYHYALYGNPLETSRQLGHKASDQVLFDHYRALATKEKAEQYFSIMPERNVSKVVEFAG